MALSRRNVLSLEIRQLYVGIKGAESFYSYYQNYVTPGSKILSNC